VRAWCDDATHEAAVAVLADERRRSAILSLAGAVAAHCDRLGVLAPARMAHVLAGLAVLSGRTTRESEDEDLLEAATAERVARLLECDARRVWRTLSAARSRSRGSASGT
jgi:hypothetical protein